MWRVKRERSPGGSAGVWGIGQCYWWLISIMKKNSFHAFRDFAPVDWSPLSFDQPRCPLYINKPISDGCRHWAVWLSVRMAIVFFSICFVLISSTFSPWCSRCHCPPQLEGPDCQQTRLSFLGDGYAWFPPIRSCFDSHISLEFMTGDDDGLLLYAGPVATLMPGDAEDSMALGKEWNWIFRCVPWDLFTGTALKRGT